MILLAAFLLLVAVGLLAGGLAQGSAALQWGSFAASALAAVVLAASEVRRRRAVDGPAAPREPGPAPEPEPAAVAAEPAAPVAPAVAPPAVPEPARTTSAHAAAPDGPATGAHAAATVSGPDGEPPVEEVEVTDLLLVLDLTDEVFVVDEHPRYHLAGCPHLDGVGTIPLPMVEARRDGFTPCGTCAPDRHLAERERAHRTA